MGAVPKVLRQLHTHLPILSLAIWPGLDLPPCHFCSFLNTDKEMSWLGGAGRDRQTDLSLLWLPVIIFVEHSFRVYQVGKAARIIFLCHSHSSLPDNHFRMEWDGNVECTRTCLWSFKHFITMKFDVLTLCNIASLWPIWWHVYYLSM